MAGLCLTSSLAITTGCIEETFPTNGATEEQLTSSDMATSAMVWAMPAALNKIETISDSYHWDWGYGSIMHVRDVMTEDMAVISSGYDWYQSWEQNIYQGESYVYPQFIWNYYWQAVLTTNKLISAINPESASEAQMGYLAVAHAFRAFFYLDMARMFEFLPNDKTTGTNVEGLTVPIVDENTTASSQGMINGNLQYTSKNEISIPEGVVTGEVNYTQATTNNNKSFLYSGKHSANSLIRPFSKATFWANKVPLWTSTCCNKVLIKSSRSSFVLLAKKSTLSFSLSQTPGALSICKLNSKGLCV